MSGDPLAVGKSWGPVGGPQRIRFLVMVCRVPWICWALFNGETRSQHPTHVSA